MACTQQLGHKSRNIPDSSSMLEQHAYLLDYFVEFPLALSPPSPSKMLQRSFADGEHVKAQLEQLLVIE